MYLLLKRIKTYVYALCSGVLFTVVTSSSVLAEGNCEVPYQAVDSHQKGPICAALARGSNVTQSTCVFYYRGGSSSDRQLASCSSLDLHYKHYTCDHPFRLVKNTSMGEICGQYINATKTLCQYYMPTELENDYKVVECDTLDRKESGKEYNNNYDNSDEKSDDQIIKDVLKKVVVKIIDES
jgi:hypothetical protein